MGGHPEGPGSLKMSVLGVQGVLGTHNHTNLVRQAARGHLERPTTSPRGLRGAVGGSSLRLLGARHSGSCSPLSPGLVRPLRTA